MALEIKLPGSPSYRVDYRHDGTTTTRQFHGSMAECINAADNINIYDPISSDGGIISSISVNRLNAQRATLEISSRKILKTAWWGVTFCEISKPIKNWLAEKMRNPGQGGTPSTEEQIAAELVKIDLWENQLNLNPTAYRDYKYDGVTALTGDTLKLAQKIRNGVDSYSIYAPVATLSRTSDEAFDNHLDDIGRYCTELTSAWDSNEWPVANGDQFDAIKGLAPIWLKNADSITHNSDNTITRTEQFQGLTWIDEDLYKQIGDNT